MISDFYKQSVLWKQVSGRDIDGMQTTGAGVSIQARLQDTANAKVTVDNLGNEVVTNAELWCSTSHGVVVGDIFEYNGVVYEAVTVGTKRVGSGDMHHNKVMLKRTREQ